MRHRRKKPKGNRNFLNILEQIRHIAHSLGLKTAVHKSQSSASIYVTVYHPVFGRNKENYVIRLSDHGGNGRTLFEGRYHWINLDIGEHRRGRPFDVEKMKKTLRRRFDIPGGEKCTRNTG